MRRLLMTLAVLTMFVAACGDDDDAATTTDTSAADEAAAPDEDAPAEDERYGGEATGGGAATGTAVTIVDFAFDPGTIEVAAGDTVTWTNEDGVAHTVTAGSSGAATDEFDEALDAGASAEVTFDEAGTFDYFCAIHPTMTGQVVVS